MDEFYKNLYWIRKPDKCEVKEDRILIETEPHMGFGAPCYGFQE